MFIQRKIVAKLHGIQMAELDASLRLKSLKDCVNMFGNGHNLQGCAPTLKMSTLMTRSSIVPYEKGFHLLEEYLEDVVGGAANFEPFIKAYT